MFDKIEDALSYIESKRTKRSLDEFKKTLEKCNINVEQKNIIHIAGTNGKGSTVNYLRAILNGHGYKVGTFTSPYLISHNDRIRVDDIPIDDEVLLQYINKYYSIIEEDGLSMFEIDVLIMLDYFNSLDLDYRIIETGMGGRRDKTNVVKAKISVITNCGKDHMEFLGDSIEQIVYEKTGIIKENQMFITSETQGALLTLMQEECDKKGAMMYVVPEHQVMNYPFVFKYRDMEFTLKEQGIFQVMNARLALTIASKLIHMNQDICVEAIEKANWKGRFEPLLYKDKKIFIDGAHNVPGIYSLIQTLQVKKQEDNAIIFSCLKDKNFDEMIDMLINAGHRVYLTSFESERKLDLSLVTPRANLFVIERFEDAIERAYSEDWNIVVTGSLQFISTVRKYVTKLTESYI